MDVHLASCYEQYGLIFLVKDTIACISTFRSPLKSPVEDIGHTTFYIAKSYCILISNAFFFTFFSCCHYSENFWDSWFNWLGYFSCILLVTFLCNCENPTVITPIIILLCIINFTFTSSITWCRNTRDEIARCSLRMLSVNLKNVVPLTLFSVRMKVKQS